LGRAGRVPFSELYPGICLTTEENQGKTSVSVVKKYPDISVAVVQYTFTHKQYTEPKMGQNTQKGTYITIRILKRTQEHII
jgi:hypothetical protein